MQVLASTTFLFGPNSMTQEETCIYHLPPWPKLGDLRGILSLKDQNIFLSLTLPSDFLFGMLLHSPASLSSSRVSEGEVNLKKMF